MTGLWTIFFIGLNLITTILLACYGLTNFYLLLKSRHWQDHIRPTMKHGNNYPMVTIQLPFYNEPLVAERIILSALSLDYPQDKLQIQILDDSSDETTLIVQSLVSIYQLQGFDISLVHRKKRHGYKAGALANGLKTAKGDFIAIFDADCIIPHDFLTLTLPYFSTNPSVGLVQTRWNHLNRYTSILTQVLGINLDMHFLLEQPGRKKAGAFLSFNGTGGVWRKSCILSSGGWSFDTLTEDLDLSYRAQFLGWKIVYLEDVLVYQELPSNVPNMLSQQIRWATGTTQCFRKHIITLLKHPDISLRTKILGFFQLTNTFTSVLVLLNLLTFTSILFSNTYNGIHGYFFTIFYLILSSFGSIWVINVIIISKQDNLSFGKILPIVLFNAFLSLSLSFKISIAFFKGLITYGGNFDRTEKYALTDTTTNKKIFHVNTFKVKNIYTMTPELIIGSFFIFFSGEFVLHDSIIQFLQIFYPGFFALAMFWLAFTYCNQIVCIPLYKRYFSNRI